MLEIVHLFQFQHMVKPKADSKGVLAHAKNEGWYIRIPGHRKYEYPDPHMLALFIIPKYAKLTSGNLQPWHWEDKMPKKGIHLSMNPNVRTQRTHNLLQATRGLLLFTPQYDPEWFIKPEDAAYWLGYNKDGFLTYYGRDNIIIDYIFKGKPPAEFFDGMEDASFKI